MDPLSIIASTITVATVAAQSLEKLRTIYVAKRELQDLAVSIERWSIVLKHISIALDPSSQECTDNYDEGLLSLVQSAKKRLDRINDLHQRCFVSNTSSGNIPQLKRFRWQNLRSEVIKISGELDKDHGSIQIILSSMSFRRLDLQYKSIAEVTYKVSKIEALLSTQTTSIPNTSQSGNCIDTDSLQRLILQEHGQELWEIRVDTFRQIKSSCKRGCSCVCHASYHMRSPQFLDNFLGSLVFRLPQNLRGRIVCNEYGCKRNCAPLRISYYLPAWFIQIAIISQIQVDPLAEQKFGLKVIRIVADDADVFNLVKKGDINGLIPIFQNRLASPNVVNHSWHVPLLSYAVQGNHIGMCKFLLNAGADPTLENRSNICALDRAWDAFLMKLVSHETAVAFQKLFSLYSDSPWIEEQQFYIPHKIVLGITGMQLDSQLKISTADINQQDSKGRTALCWAAIRGDVKALQVLLEYGADPNTRTINGNTPLALATLAPSPACIAPLLQSDVSVNWQNAQGFSALHYAAYYKNDRSYLEPLIEAGANLDANDQYGWSPLHSAVEYDHLESAKVLLNHGANIEHKDKDGLTPLHHSISSNSHEVLAVLLSSGANQRAVSQSGETILHFAAKSGDSKTLDIILAKLSEAVEFDARDLQTLTAADVMERRSDVTASLKTQFQNLIQKAHAQGLTASIPEEQDSEAEEGLDCSVTFFDALEQLI